MQVTKETKITVSLTLIISLIVSIVSWTIYFMNIRWDIREQNKDLQNKDNEIIKEMNNQYLYLTEKLNNKADKLEVNTLEIKMNNIESMLLEIKQDLKEIQNRI